MEVNKDMEAIEIDRADLLAILEMRFGEISREVVNHIYEIQDRSTLERLILVSANAASWEIMLSELYQSESTNREAAFRIVGENFNPLSI